MQTDENAAAIWARSALLPSGWHSNVRMTLAKGRIFEVVPGVAPAAGDDICGIALPGLSNVHSHAFQRGLAGLTERRGPAEDSFWTWREVMYRFLDRLEPDDVEALTAQAYVEMLETGFTRVGEFHYLHRRPDGGDYDDVAELAARVAAAAHCTGIGLTLLPVFYAHGGFGGAAATPGQRRFLSTRDSFQRLFEASAAIVGQLDGARLGVAPHSLRAVTPDELACIVGLGAGLPVHIHASEQAAEVADCLSWSGCRPVEWLLDHMPVDPRWTLIHATHLTAAEAQGLTAAGAAVGLCPITEANLGDGIFPADPFLHLDGRFGIGTDSNVLIDAAAELRMLEYSQRLQAQRRNILAMQEGSSTGGSLFRRALVGGATSLGGGEAGLMPGADADIVALDDDHVCVSGLQGDSLLDAWIFSGRAGLVDRVWARGRLVVRDGRHVAAEAVGSRYRQAMARMTA